MALSEFWVQEELDGLRKKVRELEEKLAHEQKVSQDACEQVALRLENEVDTEAWDKDDWVAAVRTMKL